MDQRQLERYYERLENHATRMNEAKLAGYDSIDDLDIWLSHNKAKLIERINVNHLEGRCETYAQEQAEN